MATMLSFYQDNLTSFTSFSKKQYLLSTAMKMKSDWIFAQDLPSDISVQAGVSTFSLHKFLLISKCGFIKKLCSEASDTKTLSIEILDIPGGPEAFELAVMFCYGINFEISTENIAMLRCASEFLEMTEDLSAGNLLSRTEVYLEEVVLTSLSGSVAVLHKSEELLPMAEKVKLVSRCIDAIAYLACNNGSLSSSVSLPKSIMDWWAEELIVLRIDTFQRVLLALKSRGFKEHAIGPVIMLYAQYSLRGLDIFGRGRKKIEPKKEHGKRVVLETIVSLLPTERNTISVSFLSMLLRAAIYLETTVACRLDLEKRISLQLTQAALDDILIPSFDGDVFLDFDAIQRIFINYLQHENDVSKLGYNTDEDCLSPPHGDIERVGRLMERYIAEIASDSNLGIAKFMNFAERIPEQAKVTEDGMYRAVDIYLKAHQLLTEAERKKICSLMDCQRLSREACAHAAQNDRLPAQTVVQVLFYEQQRIRDSTRSNFIGANSPAPSDKSSYSTCFHDSADQILQLKRENDNLKLELIKARMQINETAKPVSGPKIPSADKPPLPKKSFMNSVSKKMGRLYPFIRSETVKEFSEKTKIKPPKNRRYSIS